MRILAKHKKPFTDGAIVKDALTAIAESPFVDNKNKDDILSAIGDMQLGANTLSTPFAKANLKICQGPFAKAKQRRSFKLFLEECTTEYGDLLLHTDVRWLSRGKILQCFLSFLGDIKTFMESRGDNTTLLSKSCFSDRHDRQNKPAEHTIARQG